VAVTIRGRVDVFEPRGEYQLLVDWLEPQGLGALQLAFEQLKKKLEEEGLFAAERKRALPRFPRRIGIVTSPAGAVIRDMVTVLSRRFPGVHIRLFPALVQGQGAALELTQGIEHFSKSGWADLVIVGRGGGSLEDLWAFNEEPVARAIAACSVPVIAAVGHETDFTIAEFVADLRAATPSAAAELAVPNMADLAAQIESTRRSLDRAVHFRLARYQARVHQLGIERATGILQRRLDRFAQRVDDCESRARDLLRRRIADARRRVDALETRLRRRDLGVRLADDRRRLNAASAALERLVSQRIASQERRLGPLSAALGQLSPLRVLDRGYAIVQTVDGRVLRTAAETAPGDEVNIRLSQGRVHAAIISTTE
jgi:exodeoxyribonuclease VII large subunit